MTVMVTDNSKRFHGSGSAGPFTWNWRFLANAEISVYRVDEPNDAYPWQEERTLLTEGVDYTLTGAGSYQGGRLTLAAILAGGKDVIVDRNTEATQKVSIRNQGNNFRPEIHEEVFDHQSMVVQDRDRRLEHVEATTQDVADMTLQVQTRTTGLESRATALETRTGVIETAAETETTERIEVDQSLANKIAAVEQGLPTGALDDYSTSPKVGDLRVKAGLWFDTRAYPSIQASIDACALSGGGNVIDVRSASYTGAGFTVKAGVHFYASPVNYTVSSSIIVAGSGGFHGASSSNNNGTRITAANGLNADVLRSDTVLGNLVSLVRSGNVVTATTVAAHGLVTGGKAAIINPADLTFEGSSTGVVVTVTGPSTFTYANNGADGSGGAGGWIVQGDTVGWQWGVIENFRVNGNSANNTYGAGVHVSLPCENAHVRHITVSDSPQDGTLISLAAAGSGNIGDIAGFSNKGAMLNVHFYENSLHLGPISGDANIGPLLRVCGGNTTSVTTTFIKSEVQTDIGGTKQDPVVLLVRRPGHSTPSFSVLGGYAFGPVGTPKNDLVQISGAGTWRVLITNMVLSGYVNAINDISRTVTVPAAYVDRRPYFIYSAFAPGLYAGGGTNVGLSNTSALSQTDYSGVEKNVIYSDTSNNTYIRPIGGTLYLLDAAGVTYISLAANTITISKTIFSNGQIYAGQFTSAATNPADLGTVRFAKADTLRFRNNANTGNVMGLKLDTDDAVLLGDTAGVKLPGPITLKPLDSATPSVNGEMTFEATSNTSLKVKLKGTDGVVRSVTLALS